MYIPEGEARENLKFEADSDFEEFTPGDGGDDAWGVGGDGGDSWGAPADGDGGGGGDSWGAPAGDAWGSGDGDATANEAPVDAWGT